MLVINILILISRKKLNINIHTFNTSHSNIFLKGIFFSEKVIAKKNVVIAYRDIKITCDYAEVETETKKAYARGHVIIFHGDKPNARGEEVTYDFANQTGSFPNAETMIPPWYGYGDDIRQIRGTARRRI